MLVLLGVPWIFSAFAVIDASHNSQLQHLEAVFNVSLYASCSFYLVKFFQTP